MFRNKMRLVVLATILVLLFALPAMAQAASSGSCGDNLTWTLDDNVLLTISGEGAMYNFDFSNRPWNREIKNVVIEAGVTTIGDYAFYGCGELESVSSPESIAYIGTDAFRGCISLPSITFYDNIVTENRSAFNEYRGQVYFVGTCGEKLSYVRTNEGLLTITGIGKMDDYTDEDGHRAPWYGKWSVSVVIEEGVSHIGDYAFQGNSIGQITIPNTVTSIGDHAFEGSVELSEVTIPDSVITIGEYAFANSGSLNSVTLSHRLEIISASLFVNC